MLCRREMAERFGRYIRAEYGDAKYKRFSRWNLRKILQNDQEQWMSDGREKLLVIGSCENGVLRKIKIEILTCPLTKMRSLFDRDVSMTNNITHELLFLLIDTLDGYDFSTLKKYLSSARHITVSAHLTIIIDRLTKEMKENSDSLKLCVGERVLLKFNVAAAAVQK